MLGLCLFAYNYGDGQWLDQGVTGGLQILSYTPMSAAFVGDGTLYDIGATTGNGVSWLYQFDGVYGNWTNPGLGIIQFAYNYGSGQWLDQGVTGGPQTLSYTPMSAAFVGDGTLYDIGATTRNGVSWLYQFDGVYGNWTNPGLGIIQFAYNYGSGQWLDQGVTGGLKTLTYTPMSAEFIGDGNTYDIGATPLNGVSWQYQFDGVYGNWTNPGLGIIQFAYNYGSGQWLDQGVTGGLKTLTYTPMSAEFIGDGNTYDIGATPLNGVSWQYQFNGAYGNWMRLGQYRFAYDYTYSKWLRWGGTSWRWGQLSASGVSADFMGDGATHNIGTFTAPWYFTYNAGTGLADDRSQFSRSATGDNRFAYRFADSRWFDYDVSASTWVVLGNSGASPAFIGDGSAHSLGTWHAPGSGSWWFTYNAGTGPSNDQGQFSLSSSGGNRFAYGYNMGQWFQYRWLWEPVGRMGSAWRLGSFTRLFHRRRIVS